MIAPLFLTAILFAAPADSLPYGGTVRVLTEDAAPVTGTLIEFDQGTLRLRLEDGSYRAFPWGAIASLQVKEDRPSKAGTGFALGAGIGMVAGVVVGQIVGEESGGGSSFGFTPTRSEASLGLAIAGFVGGGVVGAVVGASMGGDRWVDVPLGEDVAGEDRAHLGVRLEPGEVGLRLGHRF